MKNSEASINYHPLDKISFYTHKNSFIQLYIDAFSHGETAQYIPMDEAATVMNRLMMEGKGWSVFVENVLVGCIIYHPFALHEKSVDVDFPDIDIKKTAYISEVMVAPNFQNKGIASVILEKTLKDISQSYNSVVIRVWNKNKSALHLYEKKGFKPFASITQTKLASENETFEMQKIYMIKNF